MPDSLQKPIIFIGAPRSGTTIISEIIFQHPDLGWPSNYHEFFPKKAAVNYIRRFSDNRFWRISGNKKQLHQTSVLNKYYFKPAECYRMWEFISGESVDFSRGFLLDEKVSIERKAFIRNYFLQLVRKQGRNRFATKITGPPRIGYLKSMFPDAVFVLIRRDFIPGISSLLKVKFWKDLGLRQFWWNGPYNKAEIEWAAKNADNPALLAAYQLKKIRWAEDLEIEKYHPDILKISYEDFVNRPQENIQAILAHCDLKHHRFIDKYLEKNPLIARNKKNEHYFTDEELRSIQNVLRSPFIS